MHLLVTCADFKLKGPLVTHRSRTSNESSPSHSSSVQTVELKRDQARYEMSMIDKDDDRGRTNGGREGGREPGVSSPVVGPPTLDALCPESGLID